MSSFEENIYLDYNSTTPLAPEVTEGITDALVKYWGNPSSSHATGKRSKSAIDEARLQVSRMLKCNSDDIIFTSGGTEANNLAIFSAVEHFKLWRQGNYAVPHIITTDIEHDATIKPLKNMNVEFTQISIKKSLTEEVLRNIADNTCLVTIMYANNETGVILKKEIEEISVKLRELNVVRESEGKFPILLHTDASQAIGKIDVTVGDLHIDYLTVTGHKFYGPRIGALFARNHTKRGTVYPMLYGGGQERGLRPGTENTPMIIGLGIACKLVTENLELYAKTMSKMAKYLRDSINNTLPGCVKFNIIDECLQESEECKCRYFCPPERLIDPQNILPNTVSIAFVHEELTGARVLSGCKVLEASLGAACHSSSQETSVLVNSGICCYHAARTIRLSTGRETNKGDIDAVVGDLKQSVQSILEDHGHTVPL